MIIENLITDRTLADVAVVGSLTEAIKNGTATEEQVRQYLEVQQKGAYNYTDLNRVEEAVAYVALRLKEYGYLQHMPITRSWTVEDIPRESDLTRYLNNVATLRRAIAVWASTPAAPSGIAGFGVNEANALEQILIDVDQILTRISQAWFYSGDLYAAEV